MGKAMNYPLFRRRHRPLVRALRLILLCRLRMRMEVPRCLMCYGMVQRAVICEVIHSVMILRMIILAQLVIIVWTLLLMHFTRVALRRLVQAFWCSYSVLFWLCFDSFLSEILMQ